MALRIRRWATHYKVPTTLLGQRLFDAILLSGMTQTEIAEQAGINWRTLSRVIHNDIPNPSIWTMLALAEVLEVSLDWLVGREEKES